MLTKKDFEKLSGMFNGKIENLKDGLREGLAKKFAEFLPKMIKAEKEVFATKEEYREDFAKLQSSVDGFMGKVETETTERLAMVSRIDRHEKWIKHVAKEVNVPLPSDV